MNGDSASSTLRRTTITPISYELAWPISRFVQVISFISFLSIPIAYGWRLSELMLIALIFLVGWHRKIVFGPVDVIVISSGLMIASGIWVSSATSGDAWVGLYQGIRYLLLFTFVYLSFKSLALRAPTSFLDGIIAGSICLAACGVFVYLLAGMGFVSAGVSAGRLSLWVGVNSLASILASSAAVLFFYLLFYRANSALFLLIAFLLVLLPLIFTISFGGFISFGSMLAVIVFLSLFNYKSAFRVGVACLGAVLIAAILSYIVMNQYDVVRVYVPSRLETRFLGPYFGLGEGVEMDSVGSIETRLLYLSIAWDQIKLSPILGLGGASREALDAYPHTLPVILWLEGGILSIGGYVVLTVGLFIYFVMGILKHGPGGNSGLGLVMHIGWIMSSLAHPHMYQLFYYSFLFMFLSYSTGGYVKLLPLYAK